MKSRNSGFSLVEVLVSLLLTAIVLLAVAPLFLGATKSNATGWDYSSLNELARERLEELLQFNFNDPRLAVTAGSTVTINGVSQTARLYGDQTPNTTSDGTKSVPNPYELVYIVQDYLLTDLVSTGNPPVSTHSDTDGTWNITSTDLKYITVIAASGRTALGGSKFDASLINGLGGKQIRISAVKSP